MICLQMEKTTIELQNKFDIVELQNKSNPNINSWKTLQEESSWHGRLSQPIFLKHLNKTHQGIMCETKIKIAFIKKHVYKERKETTQVEVDEEKHTLSYIYENKVQSMS